MKRIALLALLCGGCTQIPLAPVHRHEMSAKPGRPGAYQPAFAGYYTDGQSWLRIGAADSASLVSMTGERVEFQVRLHGGYVTGRVEYSDFVALYDTLAFVCELHWSDGEREEYVTRRLAKATRIDP